MYDCSEMINKMMNANLPNFPLNSGDVSHYTSIFFKSEQSMLINATIFSIFPITNKYPSDVHGEKY